MFSLKIQRLHQYMLKKVPRLSCSEWKYMKWHFLLRIKLWKWKRFSQLNKQLKRLKKNLKKKLGIRFPVKIEFSRVLFSCLWNCKEHFHFHIVMFVSVFSYCSSHDSLKFNRLLRVVFSSQQRLNRPAVNAVQWRHSLPENRVVILIGWLSKHSHNYVQLCKISAGLSLDIQWIASLVRLVQTFR